MASVIGLSLTFVGQLLFTVWWGATFVASTNSKLDAQSAKLDTVLIEVHGIESKWYTQDDARRDLQRLDSTDMELARRINRLESALDGKLR